MRLCLFLRRDYELDSLDAQDGDDLADLDGRAVIRTRGPDLTANGNGAGALYIIDGLCDERLLACLLYTSRCV